MSGSLDVTPFFGAGVSCSEETVPHQDPTVGLCLGPDGGPRGGGRFLISEVPMYLHVPQEAGLSPNVAFKVVSRISSSSLLLSA